MTQVHETLAALRRPRLLVSAARFGLCDYNRERTLRRLLRESVPPSPAAALERLLQIEARMEATRRDASAGYSAARHIEILIALMGEARLSRPDHRPAAIAAE